MQQPDSIAGRYRVVRPIGRGGMGTVWLCTDETLHREVAIKEIGSLPGESPSDTARAMREARLTAALNHKNAVSIYDVVEHAGRTWLVMEYVPSQTLSQLLASAGRLPPDRVAHIGAQVAAALSTAHSRGIVHRDIKPGNILVGDEDVAMISDFGIARGHQDAHLTQTGLVTGTPAFFSPELARGEEPTYSSDVWALGITLYAATEGGPPYEYQSNPLAMLTAITQEPLPAPTHAGPLTAVLAGMLNTDTRQRLTMAQSLAALRRAEQETKATSSSDAPTVAASPPATHEPRDQTSVIQAPVEPAYERSVPLPLLSSGQPLAHVSHQLPPPRSRSPFSRLAIAALALLVVVGAGALLWDTLGFGTEDGAGLTPSNPPSAAGPKSKDDRSGKGPSTADSGASDNSPKSEDPPTSREPPSSEKPPTSADPTSADPTTD
ncbi:MAG: protein kinase, partial [Nocardioidaceae bacterium]|nr:protein kinase [Nocardioidaceae bacterium]